MQELVLGSVRLQLLPQRAVYIEAMRSLLVADVHLGKPETFQAHGVPVSSQINDATLARLQRLCQTWRPQQLWILGDLFHSQIGLVETVKEHWCRFLEEVAISVHLLLGNHDRPLKAAWEELSIHCWQELVQRDAVLLSHEPQPVMDADILVNICGHVHPRIRLQTTLDSLRLPCFHWQPSQRRLTLPSFGEFTGGYDIALSGDAVAYGVAEDQIIPFQGHCRRGS
ncbi:serine/threonine phosphatase [Halomicronema hongdechloris C2206]|uniref:Serine/threonine phosphatase n=1 Tax=Halomicronema hongdechloris C2206 TaxID=1641165 RepID=A0A1Z3HKZ5_9CYAN|nr:ligase-associated DNA damage response endonuclease PdeM [Halomicronema hongdechloris]ASC70973.1 serine/threonine phosphatase [Halomicronema hongdechloris C2206]